MAPRDPSRLISYLADLLLGHSQGSEIWACVSGAIHDSLFSRNPESQADLSNAYNYPAFFSGALEFAVFPHTRRPPHAEPPGITNRLDAWKRVTSQIRENARYSSWQQARRLGAIEDTFSRAFSQIGKCRFPLYIQPSRAREGCDIWNSICMRHMGPFPHSRSRGPH